MLSQANRAKPNAAPRRRLTALQLDLISVVARSASLRAAAGEAGMSQPALSRQLQQMEDRLGQRLVERSPSGVRLTDAGERVLALAQYTQQLESQLLFELSDQRDRLRGHVRVCGYSSVMRSVVLPAIGPLLHRHPALTISLQSEELYLVPGRGIAAEADVFLTQAPLSLEGFSHFVVGHELNALVEPSQRECPASVFIDHEPNDRFTEHYLGAVGMRVQGPIRRIFLDDIYGLIDGVAQGLGRAVVPLHLLEPRRGIRVDASVPILRVPVVLNVRSLLLNLSGVREVVQHIRDVGPVYLARNDLNASIERCVDGAYVGPAHRFEAS